MLNLKRKPAIGNPILGIAVNGNRVLASATLAEAHNLGVVQPSFLSSLKTAREVGGAEGVALAKLHNLVQRSFDKERKHRAQAYADYLINLRSGALGGTPPINLFSSMPLVETDDGLFVPFGAQVFAIDGETQLEARYINANRMPETQNDDIPFVIWHNISPEHAAQIVHDFNKYAHPIRERDMAARNIEGALTKAVSSGVCNSGVPTDSVNSTGTALRKKSYVTSYNMLLGAACGVIDSKSAMAFGGYNRMLTQYNIAGVSVPEKKIADVICNLVQVAITQPEISRATPLPVWIALGAAGSNRKIVADDFAKALSGADKAERGERAQGAFAALKKFI